MTGILKQAKIIVEDEKKGNRLYSKGYFGQPLSNNGLELDLYEGLYLLEADRLEITDENGNDLRREKIIEKISEEDFHREYLPYKDMRMRGYVLKKASDPASFRVFPRGGGPNKTPTKYWLCTYRENDTFKINQIIEANKQISNLDKTMMTALVDEEGDVTYYIFSTIDLKGEVERFDQDKLKGSLFGDGTIIKEDFERLHDDNFYGFKENDTLRLSIYETLYLTESKILTVEDINTGEVLTTVDLRSIYKKNRGEFETEYKVYKDLRDRGLIPKTGFKYGTPFRAYPANPDKKHAEYIVQPLKKDYECQWYQVSRAVRVAHSVRKDFLYARVKDGDVDYLKIKRDTP
ncbi:MAG: tRNA-intron lyase [Candidatus Thermoplasmatota archaeon]|nr:tRNA-intron lyase [Candidatus Thermoplasmatota archaeon]MBS3789448.1 tRNA-intron lyase [Candidatus Thermoplasmatota archaeon]